MSPLEALGQVIRERRARIGMSQATLAELIGVERGYVAHFEHGRSDVTFTRLVSIAAALDWNTAKLASAVERRLLP